MAYVFTANKASSIRLACKANFLASTTTSLITVCTNTIYVHKEHSLDVSYEFTCYGRITSITPFKYYDSRLDQLFLTTQDNRYFVLSFLNGQVCTSTAGNINSVGLSTPEIGHRVFVCGTYIICYLYNGIVSAIPIHQAANPKKRAVDGNRLLGIPQQLRLDEIKIHGIAAVTTLSGNPTFGVLYRDMNLETHFKTYEVYQRKQEIELRKGTMTMDHLENGTTIIIALKDGSICTVGESNLYTRDVQGNQMEYPIATPTLFNSLAQILDQEWVLGDDYGILYKLSFSSGSPILSQMAVPKPTESPKPSLSIPAVLVGMNSSELFLGSHYSHSYLLTLPSLEIIASKDNTGPISDLIVEAATGAAGSSSLVAATGAYRDGAMKVIKYGVGISEMVELEMPNIRGVWGISELSIIVIGFVVNSLVLRLSEDGEFDQLHEEAEELVYAFCTAQKLVLVKKNELVLLTDDGVQLKTQSIGSIMAAKFSNNTLYVINGGAVQAWGLVNEDFVLQYSKEFSEQEISAFEVAYESILVSFWSGDSIWVSNLDFSQQTEMQIESAIGPRSIVLQQLSNMEQPVLLIAMPDGTLLSYTFDPKSRQLSNRKESILGTTPISLHVFSTREGPNIFAVCDRPTVIHSARGKIAFSNVSIDSCAYFAAFESRIIQSRMAIATDKGLIFGSIDDIQKLQITSIPLNESCRRLVRLDDVLGALTMRLEVELVSGNEMQRSFIKIFDPVTFEKLDEHELQTNEMCQSICSILVDDKPCLAVGTAIADDGQDECLRGRIIIFGIQEAERTLWIRSQVEVPGSVYCLATVDNYLVAGVNSFVRLFSVSAESFKEVHKHRTSTYTITMAALDDTVLIGDLMKSISYLRVKDGELQEIARDYIPTWMTAVQYCDDRTFVGADADGNIILYAETTSTLPENQRRLDRIGQFRYGEMINRLVPGTFIVPEDTSIVQPHTLFGTVDGSIGCIGTIDIQYANLLLTLQSNIGSCRPTLGNLSHAEFRAYKSSNIKADEPERFVDGDLIEEYLDLTEKQKLAVCEGLDKTPAEVERIVENLARLR